MPSINEALGRIKDAGGQILVPKQRVPGFGWLVVFREPGGVVQGAFEETDK